MGLALIVIAGCLDSQSGPFTVTVTGAALVTSDPPGLSCGRCEDLTNMGGCPPEPYGAVCSYEFPAGTRLRLFMNLIGIYFTYSCTYDPSSAAESVTSGPDSCSFVVDQDTTVHVGGAEAFR
jgi:hypothetical protein